MPLSDSSVHSAVLEDRVVKDGVVRAEDARESHAVLGICHLVPEVEGGFAGVEQVEKSSIQRDPLCCDVVMMAPTPRKGAENATRQQILTTKIMSTFQ